MTINVIAINETYDWADEIQQKVLGSKIYTVYILFPSPCGVNIVGNHGETRQDG